MSNPGIPMGMTTAQMTPEMMAYYQQQSDQARKMAMAQSLMGNQAKGQNGGLANGASDILGAIAMKNMAQQSDPQNQMASQTIQQRYGMDPSQAQKIMNPSMLSQLFSMGGGG